jgi:hypothetical protein
MQDGYIQEICHDFKEKKLTDDQSHASKNRLITVNKVSTAYPDNAVLKRLNQR